SRRRHTRFSRDWSSDVCSSDLIRIALMAIAGILSACDGPDPGVDGGHFDGQVRDAEMPDASCPLGQLGCECDEGACESGACVMRSEERRVGKECRCRESAERWY